MRRILSYMLMCVLLITSATALAGVYKWVDENGKVHFSDRVPDGVAAKKVKIKTFYGPPEVVKDEQPGSTTGKVRILTAAWCKICDKAKAYLRGKGVAFQEYDVERTSVGKIEFQRLGGTGVPIILIGGQRMNGFSPDRLDQMLKAAGL